MSRIERMEHILNQELMPDWLKLEDESHRHHVPKGMESHMKITVVAQVFEGKTRVDRHRLVNALLRPEFDRGLHALSLHLFTPAEWRTRGEQTNASPACRDGFDKDPK